MNSDGPENLGDGGKGQLAILTAEIRVLRSEAARLASGAETIFNELLQQRQVQADTFELTVRVHDMLATLFQEPEPAEVEPTLNR